MSNLRQREVSLGRDDAARLCEAFGLGPLVDVALAARGWVSLNVLWRVRSESGVWAVKEVARETVPALEAASQIETAAIAAGIAAPTIVRALDGALCASIEGRIFRCHAYVDGVNPAADLRPSDAAAAGDALGTVHALQLGWDPCSVAETVFGRGHWAELLARGREVAATWTADLSDALEGVLAAEEAADLWRKVPRRWIGSHRDIRPENALRTDLGVLLVDWDGAGPVVQGVEVSGALRWWAPQEEEFLRAYRNVAGEVDLQEGAGETGALVWWLETNVQHALALPEDKERSWAVSALASNFRNPPANKVT